MKRILLTGANGFIGTHLRSSLEQNGFDVTCANLPQFDLEQTKSVNEFVGSRPWDLVIHLAGMSHVIDCENSPNKARAVNLDGTGRILDALVRQKKSCHFLFASTAQVYAAPDMKEVATGTIFDESRAVAPQNLYAETKYQAERLVESASTSSDLSATIVRLFNHTHKTQPPHFFLPHIFQCLKNKPEEPIPVGNLDVDRDIGSIRDLTRAFLTILEKQNWQFDTFNICSGHAKNLRHLAMGLAKRLGVPANFVVESNRLRPNEAKVLIGSHEKFTKATQWTPKIKTEDQLLDDFLCD